MMLLLDSTILLVALAGHVAALIVVLNHVHSARLRLWVIDAITYTCEATVLVAVGCWGWWFALHGFGVLARAGLAPLPAWCVAYLGLFGLVGATAVPLWLYRRVNATSPELLTNDARRYHDIKRHLGRLPVRRGRDALMARLPGNEVHRLELSDRTIELPRLRPQLDGLSIAHLSDVHFNGVMQQDYYEEVVRLTNAMAPDLIAVTGDIADREEYLDWIPQTLGKLVAPCGVYFIFGNHDWILGKMTAAREAIMAAGHTYLGGSWFSLDVAGQPVVLAGNEAPWFPAPLSHAYPSENGSGRPLKILLAHSPDQYLWARQHDFDLMLAGHTHGGQVALPRLGPLFAASRTGTQYAAGTYYKPPTVLHTSRGISSNTPLRYNAPPELTKIVLRPPVERRMSVEREVAEPAGAFPREQG